MVRGGAFLSLVCNTLPPLLITGSDHRDLYVLRLPRLRLRRRRGSRHHRLRQSAGMIRRRATEGRASERRSDGGREESDAINAAIMAFLSEL